MNTKIRRSLLAISVAGSVALVAHAASANVSSVPGIAFRPDFGSQTASFNVLNTAAGRNTGTSQLFVSGQVPFQSSSPLFITGGMSQNSNFRALVTNGVGNAAWIGQLVVGQQPGIAVNTLGLGTPPLFAGTALVVNASLEPQAFIGLVWQ